MIAYKIRVSSRVYTYIYIFIYSVYVFALSTPAVPSYTPHSIFISSGFTTEKMACFPSFSRWSQVSHCSTSFLGENSQSSFNLLIENLEIIKHLFEICDHRSLFSIVKRWMLFLACFVNGAPAHIGTQCYLEC